MFSKLWRGFAAAALSVWVGLAGTAALAADKITIGALRFTSHAPGFIAFEKGYFKYEGLDVEFKFFQAAQPIAVAIASGDIDFGVTSITGGLINLAQKGAVKVIGGVLQEEKGYKGSAILASTKAHGEGLTSPKELAGKSMAITQVGSSFHYMAAQIAEKEGFAADKIAMKPLQQVPAMIAALKSGQVDAMIIVPHIAVPLEKSGAAKIIGWVSDYVPYQVTTLFTSTKNTKDRAEVVKKFVKAYQRGIADYRAVYLNDKADAAAVDQMTKIIHKYVYETEPFDKAAPKIKAGASYINDKARLNLGDVAKQLAWFKAEKLVTGDVTLDQLVDRRFVEMYNVPK